MRFLKNKIALARMSLESSTKTEYIDYQNDKSPVESCCLGDKVNIRPSSHQKRIRTPGHFKTPEETRCTKNIVKNYGKAICSFVCSKTSQSYIKSFARDGNFSKDEFIKYVNELKENIDSVQGFRNLILINDGDSLEVQKFKKAYTQLAKVFIRCYSVNWIFNGKVTHKEAHLRFRFKLLKKIENPETFNSLK